MRVKEWIFYTLCGVVLYLSKMLLAPLPNIEPVSLLVMALAVTSGWKGLVSVYIYVFLEGMSWGFSLWFAAYLYIWLLLYICARLLARFRNVWPFALLSALFGLSFGALYLPVQALVLQSTSPSALFAWWMAGLPFDLLHSAGNGIMALLLFAPVRALLEKLHKRIIQ